MPGRTEHYLSYPQLQAIAARGETIIFHPPDGAGKSQLFAGNLPDEATLAQGDSAATEEALTNIEAEIARLNARKALLAAKAGQADASTSPPDASAGKGGKKSTAKADGDPSDPGTGTPPDATAGTETK